MPCPGSCPGLAHRGLGDEDGECCDGYGSDGRAGDQSHGGASRLKFSADPKSLADCGNACHTVVKAKDYIFQPYQKR
jgi:hypothetical protein